MEAGGRKPGAGRQFETNSIHRKRDGMRQLAGGAGKRKAVATVKTLFD
jgi:hypothetical protein